jgi:hypothetical protein
MTLVLLIEAETGASIVVDATKIRFLRELPDRGLESFVEIVFDADHSVTVTGSLKSTWKAISDAKGT